MTDKPLTVGEITEVMKDLPLDMPVYGHTGLPYTNGYYEYRGVRKLFIKEDKVEIDLVWDDSPYRYEA